jgi:hypothetical protein
MFTPGMMEAEGGGIEVDAEPGVPEGLACRSTTQFPKPAVVVNEARQRSLDLPPVHFVFAGMAAMTDWSPFEAGFCWTDGMRAGNDQVCGHKFT